MSTVFRRTAKAFRIFLWYLGGQKQHALSGAEVPPGGFIGDRASLVFPEKILLASEVLVMPGASLICAGMPPYVEGSGSISIGEKSIIREGVILQTFGGDISIGKSCTINPYCVIQGNGNVRIGDNVLIAAHVSMFAANHVFNVASRMIREQGETKIGIEIEDDVWIGSGARILDGVLIGRGAVVAAGAVVNRDVEEYSVVAGVPSRVIGKRT